MAQDIVEIFNLGLSHVGVKPVSLPTENTVQALACNRAWPSSRRETLSGNDWAFATAIESLVLVSGYTPPTGWGYAYQYPSKALRIWKVYNAVTADITVNMQDAYGDNKVLRKTKQKGDSYRVIYVPSLNSKVILSNTLDATVEYSYDLEDVTLYDPSFVTCLGYRLAADIAMPLTGDAAIANNLIKVFNAQMSEAQRLMSFEHWDQNDSPSIIDSRG